MYEIRLKDWDRWDGKKMWGEQQMESKRELDK